MRLGVTLLHVVSGTPCGQVTSATSLRQSQSVSVVCMGLTTSGIDWQEYFAVRGVDNKGDEVKVAWWIKSENIEPALPKEIRLLKPRECWVGLVAQRSWLMTVHGDPWHWAPESGSVLPPRRGSGFRHGKRPGHERYISCSKENWTSDGGGDL